MDGDAVSGVLAEERYPVRFGHGVFSSGRMSAEAQSAAVAGLQKAAGCIKDLEIQKYRAVATSAVRESPNRREFVRAVKQRAGISVEVIPGTEEMRLVHAAVSRRMLMGTEQWIMVELGGGSVEVALASSSRISWCETHAMGAVRLLELFAPGGKETKDFLELLTEYAATMRLSARARAAQGYGFIATGGNIEVLARIAGAESGPPGGTGIPRIKRGALRKVILELSRMTASERMRLFELRPDRADVILPAAVVYLHLATVFEADDILAPGGGIREGIVLDLAEKLDHRRTLRDEGAIDDAVSLGRKYSFDEAHSVHVARLAEQLFDQLTEIHGLAVRDRLLLVAAAILHDIGDFVSLKGHHKHSLYLISRAELRGLSAREVFLVGNIARYHRKSAPSVHHAEFALLSAADRERVRRLAAILRIADALDKEHQEKIRRVAVRVAGGRVEILAGRDGDLVLERWALEKKSDLFRRVFGVEVALVGQEADGDS